jgi:hypothetical protein
MLSYYNDHSFFAITIVGGTTWICTWSGRVREKDYFSYTEPEGVPFCGTFRRNI